jgi:hypothetical protein
MHSEFGRSEIGRILGNSGIGRSENGGLKSGCSEIGHLENGHLEIGRCTSLPNQRNLFYIENLLIRKIVTFNWTILQKSLSLD